MFFGSRTSVVEFHKTPNHLYVDGTARIGYIRMNKKTTLVTPGTPPSYLVVPTW
jgi:hypothetical protein